MLASMSPVGSQKAVFLVLIAQLGYVLRSDPKSLHPDFPIYHTTGVDLIISKAPINPLLYEWLL